MKKYILAMSLFFVAAVASAESVFVKEATADDPSLRNTILELVRSGVTQVSGFTLSNNAKAADFVLQPKLMKLGDAYILTIDKLKGDQVAYSSNMKAANLNEIDVVANRVVRAVLQEAATKRAATVEDVTQQEETEGTRRYQATRQWRFGFGPTWSQGLNTSASGSAMELGYVWGMDPNFDIQLNWMGGGAGKNATFGDFNLGMRYHFNTAKHALYVVGGVGRGSATANDENAFFFSADTASGWTFHGGVGYKFFRTSTVNIGVEARYHYLMADTAVTKSRPSVVNVGLAVYY